LTWLLGLAPVCGPCPVLFFKSGPCLPWALPLAGLRALRSAHFGGLDPAEITASERHH